MFSLRLEKYYRANVKLSFVTQKFEYIVSLLANNAVFENLIVVPLVIDKNINNCIRQRL